MLAFVHGVLRDPHKRALTLDVVHERALPFGFRQRLEHARERIGIGREVVGHLDRVLLVVGELVHEIVAPHRLRVEAVLNQRVSDPLRLHAKDVCVLPAMSLTEQLTVVVPSANVEPDAGAHETLPLTPDGASDAVGVNVAVAPDGPAASFVIFTGSNSTGFVASRFTLSTRCAGMTS